MGRTRTDGPDEFEPLKFDCSFIGQGSVLVTFDLSAKVADIGAPSIFRIYFLINHKAMQLNLDFI